MLLTRMLKSNNTAQCLELAIESRVENYVKLWTLQMEEGRVLTAMFSRQVVHSLAKGSL